jgi:hypothetical protein
MLNFCLELATSLSIAQPRSHDFFDGSIWYGSFQDPSYITTSW